MEDGLVLLVELNKARKALGLNPCCNGRWSRTATSPFVRLQWELS